MDDTTETPDADDVTAPSDALEKAESFKADGNKSVKNPANTKNTASGSNKTRRNRSA